MVRQGQNREIFRIFYRLDPPASGVSEWILINIATPDRTQSVRQVFVPGNNDSQGFLGQAVPCRQRRAKSGRLAPFVLTSELSRTLHPVFQDVKEHLSLVVAALEIHCVLSKAPINTHQSVPKNRGPNRPPWQLF